MFQLDLKSHKSIYQQVVDNVKELIMTDVLIEDSKLPSVRDLSRQLTVNPNTVQKAFKELERQGYVYTVSGKGTFVSPKHSIRINPNKVQENLNKIEGYFKDLLYMGMDEEEAIKLIIQTLKSVGGGKEND